MKSATASAAVLLIAASLASCVAVSPFPTPSAIPTAEPTCDPELQSCDDVWLAVYGPRGWPFESYVLETSTGKAWSGSGVARLVEDEAVSVRLVNTETCELLATFEAKPGTLHVLRFQEDGSVTYENLTGRVSPESGPAVGRRELSGCP